MNPDSLVFDVGDQVTGWGRMVADEEGRWLDLARAIFLPLFDPPRSLPRSHRSIRLIDADFDAVPTEFGPHHATPDHATITGMWLGDAIQVQSQSPTGPPPRPIPDWTMPPCPAPRRGWPRGKTDENLDFEGGDLDGLAVSVVIFRPSPDQAVLVVAASDVDAAKAVLEPQLPGRLCVVPSRWTGPQLDAVQAHLNLHSEDWALDSWGPAVDAHGQPYVEAELLRMTAEIAEWVAGLPVGLLKLVPSLTPAGLLQPGMPITEPKVV
jgi:hypothetical protein